MWWEILYWIGALCGIGCVYDLFAGSRAKSGRVGLKVGLACVILLLSWIGIAAYLLWIRKKMTAA